MLEFQCVAGNPPTQELCIECEERTTFESRETRLDSDNLNATFHIVINYCLDADSSGLAVQSVEWLTLACWYCGFESRRAMDASLLCVCVGCCQVEVSATS
jgi:hypothetical protein